MGGRSFLASGLQLSKGSSMAEPAFTISRGMVSRIMLNHYVATSLSPTVSRHLGLEDFEGAGIRVAERRLAAKDMIFAPGDPDDQVYFLLEGTVRLYKIYGDYKEATTALLTEGDVFGELSLEERSCQNAFAEAERSVGNGYSEQGGSLRMFRTA